jgi:hypothetical protein
MPVEPPREPPERVKLPTVSLKVLMPRVPLETAMAEELESLSAAPRLTVPPLTVRSPASVPLRTVVPVLEEAVPVPRLAETVPPLRV